MTMRILVADDHSLFRDGIISLLRAAKKEVVGEAGDGQAAVSEAVRLKPDLVLLDINMPKGGGLEALRQIRSKLPYTKVVMLTVSEDDNTLLEAVSLGAQGYLLKSLDKQEFLSSLEGLQRGEAAMTGVMVNQLLGAIASNHRKVSHPSLDVDVESLTRRETELLSFIASGLSNKDIAKQLHVSENTVKYHMKNIIKKTNLQNRAEVAAFAVSKGLVRNGLRRATAEDNNN